MAKYTEKVEQMSLPIIAIKDAVAFPSVTLSFEISDESFIHAAEAAFETDSFVVVCSVEESSSGKITPASICKVGTVSKIKQSIKTPEGNMRVVTEGFSRATLTDIHKFANYMCADLICKTISVSNEETVKNQAYCRAILSEADPVPLYQRRNAQHSKIYQESRASCRFYRVKSPCKAFGQAKGSRML